MRHTYNNHYHDLHAAVLFDAQTEQPIGIGIRPDFDATAQMFVADLCTNWRTGQTLLEIDLQNQTLSGRRDSEDDSQYLFDLKGTPNLDKLQTILDSPQDTWIGTDDGFRLSHYACFVPSAFRGEVLEIEARPIHHEEASMIKEG